MYFIDSDILSFFFMGNEFITKKISETVKSGGKIVISSITHYEIIKGLRWRNNKKTENALNMFTKRFPVIPLENSAIGIAADIYATLRKRGVTIGDADIFIAATVLHNNGTLITNNTRHFTEIHGFPISNWTDRR